MHGPIECLVQIGHASRWLLLTDPFEVIQTARVDRVAQSLRQVEALATSRDCYAAGYVRYEAGAAFGLQVRPNEGAMPLVWFALFEHAREVGRPASWNFYEVGRVAPSIELSEFAEAFTEIRRNIAEGNTYQVNYTWRLRASFRGDPASFFADLSRAQRGRYGAFLRTDHQTICSASPELFFEREQARMTTRPMKGTARRGRFPSEDRRRAEALVGSPKERAENVMVVDMIRNDLGRVAEIGSVDVPELFSLEPYPNVWQLTSTVTARTAAPLDQIFAATFPSASVTGAPKHRTMQIIAELEHEPRGVYAGAVGLVSPGGRAQFNVAIRTAVVDERAGALEFGVGSGVVWDSDPDQEYEECLLKGSVLGHRPEDFALLETMRWTPGEGYFLLDRHLDRLRESAHYFAFQYSDQQVRDTLNDAVRSADRPMRLRLLLSDDGAVRIELSDLVPPPGMLRVRLASAAIDPSDVFLFHKTTNRVQYERARAPKFDDVILWNGNGEVTESTVANVVAHIDGRTITPPVECGLLAGTFRAELVARGEIVEAPITIDQLVRASRIWLVNSVRGRCPAILAAD